MLDTLTIFVLGKIVFLGLQKILILRSTYNVTQFWFVFFYASSSDILRPRPKWEVRATFKKFFSFFKAQQSSWEYSRDHTNHHSSDECAEIKKILKYSLSIPSHYTYKIPVTFELIYILIRGNKC